MSFGVLNVKGSAERLREELAEAKKGNGDALGRLAAQITTFVRAGDPGQLGEALEVMNEMAISADPKLVGVLHSRLLPCLDELPSKGLYHSYLSKWARLYDGSILVAVYPNLREYAEKRVSSEVLNQPLPRNLEFERNLKNRNDKVQFFEDSYISESDDLNGSRLAPDKVLFDIAEVQAIRERLGQGEPTPERLEQYRSKIAMFNRSHDLHESGKIKASLGASGIRIGGRLDQSLEWCKHYLNNYTRLANRQISFGEFRQSLSLPEEFVSVPIKPMEFTLHSSSGQPPQPKQKMLNELMTSRERSPLPPPGRQVMTESKQQVGIHLTIHSSKKSLAGSVRDNQEKYQSPVHERSDIASLFKKSVQLPDSVVRSSQQVMISAVPAKRTEQAQNTPETIMLHQQQDYIVETGHVRNRSYRLNLESSKLPAMAYSDLQSAQKRFPQEEDVIPQRMEESIRRSASSSVLSPELVVTKYKPYLASSHKPSVNDSPSRHRKIFQKSPANTHKQSSDGFRLSDFTNEKQRRKRVVGMGPLSRTPDWVITAFSDKFTSEELFSRFRRNCLHNRSHLFKDNQLEINCIIIREGCRSLRTKIQFRNFTGQPKQVKCTYNISKSFQVVDADHVKSKFTLHDEMEHQFGLEIMAFPLGVCSLQLKTSAGKSQVLLPITLTRFVALQYLDPEEWFVRWNGANNHRYYTSRRVIYTKKILSVNEMTFLFPECAELGRRESYSFDEFGCVGRYDYFGLEFLLVFAFNVDSLLTIEAMCTKQVSEEQTEFLDYYMDTLTMLIERVDLD